MMEFTWEEPVWESSLSALRPGGSISATRFLAMMESETEDVLEDALQILEERNILLDISDLPEISGTNMTAVRLRREAQLVKEGTLPEALEENDPLRLYLEETSGAAPVQDIQDLAEKTAGGDPQAQEKLTNAMLPTVTELAFSMTGRGVLLMDLIQEGSLALWQAVLGYTQGDFLPYCRRCILRSMARTVTMQARASGVGQKVRKSVEDYRTADQVLLTRLGRNPTMEEIADYLNITLEEAELVAQILENARTVSRAKAETADKAPTAEDSMAVEDTAYFQSRARIAELLSSLGETEAKILTLRFGLEGGMPLSPAETGAKLGMTAEEVVAAEAAALGKLRADG